MRKFLIPAFNFVVLLIVVLSCVWMLVSACTDWSKWYEFTLTNINWTETIRIVAFSIFILSVACIAGCFCVMSVVWEYEEYKSQK